MNATRVFPRSVAVCSHCGGPWDEHRDRARARLKAADPDRFYVKDGIEYPLARSTYVEERVSTADCGGAG